MWQNPYEESGLLGNDLSHALENSPHSCATNRQVGAREGPRYAIAEATPEAVRMEGEPIHGRLP
jgi:hypothetical protein